KKYFGEKLCATTIPRNIRLAEAPSHGKPALLYDVRSRGAESYIRLAKEIIANYFAQAESVAAQAENGEQPAASQEVSSENQALQEDNTTVSGASEVAPVAAETAPVEGGKAEAQEAPAAEEPGETSVDEMGKIA